MRGYICERCKKTEFYIGYCVQYQVKSIRTIDGKLYESLESCYTNYLCNDCAKAAAEELDKIIK